MSMTGDTPLISPQIASDLLAGGSFYAAAFFLIFVRCRRAELRHRGRITLFAATALSSGTVHWIAILTVWWPISWLVCVTEIIAALLSLWVAFILLSTLPEALVRPDPGTMQRYNQHLLMQLVKSERVARSLQESEDRYRSAFNRTPVPLVTLDSEGLLTDVSDYWCDLLCYARREAIGRPLASFCSEEASQLMPHRMATLLADGALRDCECVLLRKDGTPIEILLSARLERGYAHEPTRIIGVVTDVTGRRLAERALREREEQLFHAQKMEAIGKLTGGIAHDFNNMLTIIDSNLEMLKPRLAQDLAAHKLVEAAHQASERAERLTGQLLAFSRRQRLAPVSLLLRQVIDEMSVLLARTAGEQNALLLTIPQEPEWACMADRDQFETALLNLVINAADAVGSRQDGAGVIEVTIGNMQLSNSEAATLRGHDEDSVRPGDYVSVTVADNGIGMSEDVRRRALEPFFTTKPVGRGVGLGLSQTYGFARQSGGTMRIISQIGRGTRIELMLPRAPLVLDNHGQRPNFAEISKAYCSLRPNFEAPLLPERLLVVEDEPELLSITAESLRASGYAVTCAVDGATALEALAADRSIALIFTDIVMPGITGVALAEQAVRMRPGIPVIFASGYSDASIIQQIPKGSSFLQKPYRISRVTSLIRALLLETQLETQLET